MIQYQRGGVQNFEKCCSDHKWKPSNNSHHFVSILANMAAAFDPEHDSLLTGVGCLNHSLQLVIHDGLFSLQSVKALIEKCRTLAGHANSSTKFYVVFHNHQRDIMHRRENELLSIKQDVVTRWNSTLNMPRTPNLHWSRP